MASDGCQPVAMNGKLAGYNRDNQAGRISFPAGVTSYRDLRTGGGGGGSGKANTLQQGVVPASDREFYTRALYGSNNKAHEKTVFNENGIPVSFSNATGSNYSGAKPRAMGRQPAAALSVGSAPPSGAGPLPTSLLPPAPLASTFSVVGAAKPLPNLGWACNAEDAAAALSAGALLVDTGGDEATEVAVAEAVAASGGSPFIVSAANGPDGGAAACEAATARLGGTAPDLMLLPAAAWAGGAAAEVAAAGIPVGLVCPEGAAAAVSQVNEIIAAEGMPTLAALKLQLDPTVAKVQRMLVGLCKRRGIRILAADPLGGAAGAEALAKTVSSLPDVQEATQPAAVLLGWCIGRGIAALPSSAEGLVPADVINAGTAVEPIASTTRSALDAAASADGLRAAAVTE